MRAAGATCVWNSKRSQGYKYTSVFSQQLVFLVLLFSLIILFLAALLGKSSYTGIKTGLRLTDLVKTVKIIKSFINTKVKHNAKQWKIKRE